MRSGFAVALLLGLAACGDPKPDGDGGAAGGGSPVNVVGTWVHHQRAESGGKIRRAVLTFHMDGTYEGTDASWRPGRDPDPVPRRVIGTWQQRGDQILTTATSADGKPFGPLERPAPVTLVHREGFLRPLADGKPLDAAFVRE